MWDFLMWGGIVLFGGGILKKGDFYMQLGFFWVGGGGCGQEKASHLQKWTGIEAVAVDKRALGPHLLFNFLPIQRMRKVMHFKA